MPVLSAQREREPGRVREPNRRPVHDLSDERERLQGAWSKVFEQEQGGKIPKLPLVEHAEDVAEVSFLASPSVRAGDRRRRSASSDRLCHAGCQPRSGRQLLGKRGTEPAVALKVRVSDASDQSSFDRPHDVS
jgi:hypothetical protein